MNRLIALLLLCTPLLSAQADKAAKAETSSGPAPVVEQTRDAKNDKEDVDKIGDRDVDGGVNFYSIEKEIRLGQQLAADVERNAKVIDDPVISEYVNRVGQNLVRNSDAQVPFTIKVIDDDAVNAFALPGGFFFVNSGLIKLAETESELAGVMAHEIAHVTARHGTRQATKGQIANYASIPLAIFLPGGWLGYGVYQGVQLAVPLTFLRFSRGYEKDADFLGMQYLYKAGYDPTSMITFFERIQAQQKRKKSAAVKMFSSHPPTGKRIKLIQESMGEILPARPQYTVNTSEFQDVRDRLTKLTRRMRNAEQDPNKPTLRRSPGDGTIDVSEGDDEQDEPANDRPTLKR
ncbi:MAG: M48 family metallopeptidase [Acidobacteria bacterium]|nr:M48 family metallopeptidase [Acidobacteriota bacterium]MDA1235369.1 M48 family metallopeptidase [Acidobacteriota bacterium]